MFKLGDKVEWVGKYKDYSLWKDAPDVVEILWLSKNGWVALKGNPKNGKSSADKTRNWYFNPIHFKLHSPELPPETIEHDGYTYTRGEKTPESWVKEGVWAVNDKGNLAFVVGVLDNSVCYDIETVGSMPCEVEFFEKTHRPFKETDWKWGMYCEFQGEVWLIFINPVVKGRVRWVNISKGDRMLCVQASEITPTFKR